ncbi:Uncharacterised protein [Mycobacterium tuberculosis]|uniref:Uncharacterized protein n=1 Tax=Mycobacterium tuberculosis TaxID=1773 RepID=A0A0U0QW79_MYCTX|nr:Uncharacterised protein [Mycobacterium tuberculosis]COX26626.1 Uncharacterised protein [Mycobacterium tuberculosis]COZ52035.1 Uncharacterised protein [Mycobacterium tuberculosis]
MSWVCLSIAANSSTMVAPGPVTNTCKPSGGCSWVTMLRAAVIDSPACDVPTMPPKRRAAVTA